MCRAYTEELTIQKQPWHLSLPSVCSSTKKSGGQHSSTDSGQVNLLEQNALQYFTSNSYWIKCINSSGNSTTPSPHHHSATKLFSLLFLSDSANASTFSDALCVHKRIVVVMYTFVLARSANPKRSEKKKNQKTYVFSPNIQMLYVLSTLLWTNSQPRTDRKLAARVQYVRFMLISI